MDRERVCRFSCWAAALLVLDVLLKGLLAPRWRLWLQQLTDL